MEQAEGTLTVEVEDAQIVGFVQIAKHDLEVVALALLGEGQRDLVGDELVDALGAELLQQSRVGEGGMRGQNDQRPAAGKQQGGFHYSHFCLTSNAGYSAAAAGKLMWVKAGAYQLCCRCRPHELIRINSPRLRMRHNFQP